MQDYYELLGVSRDASKEEIKRSYRKLAVRYHPDKNQGDKKAEDQFKKISEAYEALSDVNKRAAYDRYGHSAFQNQGASSDQNSGNFHDPFDVFKEVFSGSGSIFEGIFGNSENRENLPQHGADLRYDLEITLEEAASGLEREIEYHRPANEINKDNEQSICLACEGSGQITSSRGFFSIRHTCPSCKGSGDGAPESNDEQKKQNSKTNLHRLKIKIPAGVDTNSQLKAIGHGEPGVSGGPSGNLFVVISIKKHKVFERKNDDLYCDVSIKFTIATLGGIIQVPTLSGKASLNIPAGTQSNTTFRLRGHGICRLHSLHLGDQLVRISIEVPKKLSQDQKNKLEDFAVACGDSENPNNKNFFQKAKHFFES